LLKVYHKTEIISRRINFFEKVFSERIPCSLLRGVSMSGKLT